MKKLKLIFTLLVLATSFASSAQDGAMQSNQSNAKLIAVVNRANWCMVCRANGERFGALLMPYTAKGVKIYMNDITNDTTRAASKTVLENEGIYKAVTTVKRKGMGKMMKSCGLARDKQSEAMASGIVTFINPATHKQVKQVSIALPDEEMKKTIDKLLNYKP